MLFLVLCLLHYLKKQTFPYQRNKISRFLTFLFIGDDLSIA